MLSHVLYIALCASAVVNAQVGEPCQSPDGLPGTCIGIRQCSSLLKLLKARSPVPPATRKYLHQCQCGGNSTDTGNPLVCCFGYVHPNKHLINTETCGTAFVDKIVGGVDAVLMEFPWMALLAYTDGSSGNTTFLCGGSLITDRYVLTAAHCITSNLVSVRLGEHNIDKAVDCDVDGVCSPEPQDIAINKTLKHKGFVRSKSKIVHDIALIRLSRPAVLTTEAVQPICLPFAEGMINLEAKELTVAGWGRTERRGGGSSAILQKVDLPVWSQERCALTYASLINMTIVDTQLCAGGTNRTQDSCNGDSGGPLMTISTPDGKYVQYGVVSFGPKLCGSNTIPGVYSRVASYMVWILDNIHE